MSAPARVPPDCSRRSTWQHNLQRWMRRCTSSKRLGRHPLHNAEIVCIWRWRWRGGSCTTKEFGDAQAVGSVWPRSDDDIAYARIGRHAGVAGGPDGAQKEQHKAERSWVGEAAEASQGCTATIDSSHAREADMFAAMARKSGQGPECLIGAGVGNKPIPRIGTAT